MAVISKHRNEEVILLERGDSPFIFCRIKMPNGKWEQRSTKRRDHEAALRQAFEWHDEFAFLQGRGLSVKRRSFSAVCDLYIKSLEEEVRLGFKKPRVLKDYQTIIERFLRPYFGRKYIDLITNQNIADYRKWRASYWIDGPGSKQEHITYVRNGKTIKRPKPKGKPPSLTAENTENVVLRAVFDTALRQDILTERQIPTITLGKQKRGKRNRRPYFTKDEYEALIQFLFTWPKEPNCTNADRRWLLKHYVTFLVHTGLRPGTETDNLCWKHIREIATGKGDKRYVLSVNGKTGPRNPVASDPAFSALEQIRTDLTAAGTEVKPDMPIFCLPNGTPIKNDYFRQLFRKALAKANLLYDANGDQRSLYSLRHTYATFQLLYNKVSIYTLKEQLGTGIRMIEQHYGHLTPELAVDELTEKSVDNTLPLK